MWALCTGQKIFGFFEKLWITRFLYWPDGGKVAAMSTNGRLVAVIGSRGGAGASCLAASIAQAFQRQTQNCVLVDLCDIGAGIEVLLGIEGEPGARWPEMEAARGEVDGSELVLALPQWQGVPVLSVSRHQQTPVPEEVVLDVCAGLIRNGAIVVVDIPAPASWNPAIRALLADADQVMIATPDSTVGLAGAVAVALALDGIGDALGGSTTRRRRAAQPDQAVALRTRSGSRVGETDVAKLVGRPVMVRFREDRNLATAIELGAGPSVKSAKRLAKAGQAIANEVIG